MASLLKNVFLLFNRYWLQVSTKSCLFHSHDKLCRGEDLYGIKLSDFEDSLNNDEDERTALVIRHGKVVDKKTDRSYWWPENIRKRLLIDSELLGNRLYVFGERGAHNKFRDKIG